MAKRKNIRKIPSAVAARVQLLGGEIVVGCTKVYKITDIKAGALQHLGVVVDDDECVRILSEPIVPSKSRGKYSHRNVSGYEYVDKTLPLVLRQIPYRVKGWDGEWHTGTYDKLCYARVYVEPAMYTIQCCVCETFGDSVVMGFRLSQTMSTTSACCNQQLLEGLNIMYENVQLYGVEPALSAITDFERVQNVEWEIFPVGAVGVEQLSGMLVKPSSEGNMRSIIAERLEFLKQIGANEFIKGVNSLNGYVGGLLYSNGVHDDIAVFDNVNFGNAAYVLKGDWREMSKLSRSELRRQYANVTIKVPHVGDWKPGIANAVRKFKRQCN